MSLEQDEDLALVRKLHLELNGSGRRTRGVVPPPAKKPKREPLTTGIEAKEMSSFSHSASDSRSGGKAGKGGLKRLIKKPDSDSMQNQTREEDTTTQRNGQADVLEPQISTKIVSGSNATHGADNDVGSQRTFNPNELRSLDEAFSEHHCANLARLAADRDSAEKPQRVKCFYQGGLYGVSLDLAACSSRQSFEVALRDTLIEDLNITSQRHDIFVFDSQGDQVVCSADEPDDVWNKALQSARRIYFAESLSAAR